MSALVHKKFRFPSGCNCEEIVVRETNGLDEQAAALQVETRPKGATIFGELLRRSIVEVDGEPAQQPFVRLDQWNSRTRNLVMEAYQDLNSVQEEETAAFLTAGEVVERPLANGKREAGSAGTEK